MSNNSSAKSLLAKLQTQVAAMKQTNNNGKDDRYWQPTVDASGVGSAVLRFLPSKSDENVPFAKTYRHAFQEGSSWFIDNCATTIGQECFVCQENGKLWNSGLEVDKEVARKRKRRLEYVVNVLIVKDPGNRENEGQVKLYRFGAKIWEKVEECFSPDPDGGEEAFNPFGLSEGANFNLKIANVAGYRNYDKSKFVRAADVEDQEELIAKVHDLTEFTDPKNFKTMEEIQARFYKVTGQSGGRAGTTRVAEDDDEEFEQKAKAKPAKQVASRQDEEVEEKTTTKSKAAESIESDLDFLRDLANGDF